MGENTTIITTKIIIKVVLSMALKATAAQDLEPM